MDTIHIDICPICSSKKLEETLQCKDFLVSKKLFSLYRCSSCGFTVTQDFPNQSAIGKYYDAADYVSHTDTRKGIINRLYHTARNISLKSKVALVKKYSHASSNTLLDIGCGTGYFLDAIAKQQWKVLGIEKSESVRNQTRQRLSLDVEDSDYLTSIANQSMDTVTLWHVLEHIENLNETLDNIFRILKKDGTVFIALPNKESSDALHYKEYWAAYDVPRHLWHFSPSDFEQLAKKHRFTVVKQKTMYFDPFYISMLSEKYKQSAFGSALGLAKGFYFCCRSLFNTNKSSSIIYILKKTRNEQ